MFKIWLSLLALALAGQVMGQTDMGPQDYKPQNPGELREQLSASISRMYRK